MARASTRNRRGVGARIGRPLKILVGFLLVLLVLIILNAFALNNETESAEITVPEAQLIETTSGQLQVLERGPTGEFVPTPEAPRRGDNSSRPTDNPLTNSINARFERTPIVLIHGSAGAINWWDDLIPLLEQDHRVIAIDMLGYGGSEKPDSDYSIETQANLVAQVLGKLDVPEAILVGHSLGGKVVTSVAEQTPDLVAGLVILDTAPDNSFGGLSGGARATRTPLLGQALWRIAPDSMIRKNVEQGFAPDFEVPDKYVDDVRAMTYPAYRKSAEESEDFTAEASLPERLTEAGKPLLVIFGEQDQIYDAREALSEYAAIPEAETLLIPDSGHSPQVETPKKTADAINSFAYGIAEKAGREEARRQRARHAAKRKARAEARARRNRQRQKARRQNRNQRRQQGQASQRQPSNQNR